LEAIVADPSSSGMKKAKASNECSQLKAEDPLPLRRAKITQEAAVRKVCRFDRFSGVFFFFKFARNFPTVRFFFYFFYDQS
jgi:hypothetical protein